MRAKGNPQAAASLGVSLQKKLERREVEKEDLRNGKEAAHGFRRLSDNQYKGHF